MVVVVGSGDVRRLFGTLFLARLLLMWPLFLAWLLLVCPLFLVWLLLV